jgi:hypothetical protein
MHSSARQERRYTTLRVVPPHRKVLGARKHAPRFRQVLRATQAGKWAWRSCGELLRAGARAAQRRSAAQRRNVVSIAPAKNDVVWWCAAEAAYVRSSAAAAAKFNTRHPSAAHARVWCAASSTGGVTGVCDVMSGRGGCHKCVALGCHDGPAAQTPVNGRAARMRGFGRPPPLRPAFRQAAGGNPWMSWQRCAGSAAHPCQPKHIDRRTHPKRRRQQARTTMGALRTGGIAAAVTSNAGYVTGVCDVMSGRGWCHECVALGCHGPA